MAWDCRIGFRLNLFNVLILKVLLGQLFLLVFFSNCLLPSAQSAFVDCDQVSHCSCYRPEGDDYYEILCPNEALSVYPITVKVHPWASRDKTMEGTLEIICDYFKPDFDWRLIRGLDLGMENQGFVINKLSIKHCPIPLKNDSVTALLRHLNVDPGQITSHQFTSLRDLGQFPDYMLSSLVNLTELDLSQNDLLSVPSLANLPNLKTLHMFTNKIRNITRDTFSKNNLLQNLQMSANQLTVIEEGSLPDSIVYLNLVGNRISTVTNRTFSNLQKLKYMWLSSNRLDDLDPHAFSSLAQLRELKLDSGEFRIFPLLAHLPLLTDVSMSFNRYFQSLSKQNEETTTTTRTTETTTIDPNGGGGGDATTISIIFGSGNRSEKSRNVEKSESTTTLESVIIKTNDTNSNNSPKIIAQLSDYQGVISDLPSLSKLVLTNDGLSALPVLKNLPNLTSLYLNVNKISTIPPDAFSRLASLKILDLSKNQISLIADIQASVLTDLDLSRNSMSVIDRSVFRHLSNLKKLRLAKNQIEYIDPNAFESLTLLESVDLSNNRINFAAPPPIGRGLVSDTHLRMGSSPLRFCRSLRTMDLSDNLIDTIYNDFSTVLLQLTQLNLSRNKLRALTVADVSFLQSDLDVDLSFNEIRTIDMNYFDILLDGNSGNNITIKLDGNPLYCNCSLLKFKLFNLKIIQFKMDGLRCIGPTLPHKNLTDVSFASVDAGDLVCPVAEGKGCPEICDCWQRPFDKTVVLDCSEKFNSTPDIFPTADNFSKEFKNYGFVLNMSDNGITNIPEQFIKGLSPRLKAIDLRRNKLRSLSFLRSLGGNNVTTFNLSDNPFPCLDCAFQTDSRHFFRILDSDSLTCRLEDTTTFQTHKATDYDYESICSTQPIISIVIPVVLLLCCFIISAITYIRHGWAIRAFLYSKGFGRFICENHLEDDEEKIYDAFVSYSHRDEEWVLEELVNRLEEQEGFKLCLHFRDWTPGDWIPDQIVRSVDQSRRTVVILSKNFVESVWSRLEFKAAHSQALTARSNRLILVLMGEDLTDNEVQDDDLRVYMKMNTYIKWNDPWFWHKLKYALPHRKCNLEENRNHYTKKVQRDRAIQLDKMREKMETQVVA